VHKLNLVELDLWAVKCGIKDSQIQAALTLRSQHLPGWKASATALYDLGRELPSETLSHVLGKVAAVDSVYNAQVGRVLAMAEWILKLSKAGELAIPVIDPVTLVERIASLDGLSNDGCQVFASKYAHFCVDPNSFPVFDKYAASALLCHWGRNEQLVGQYRYRKFSYILNRVRQISSLCDRSLGDLDAYLWLAGVYREWRRAQEEGRAPQILTECRRLFEDHAGKRGEVDRLLRALVPDNSFSAAIASMPEPS
jgi:hypothetical protein